MTATTKIYRTKLRQAKGWTPERRRPQASRIRRQRPWRHATGPRTVEGKARSSQNAVARDPNALLMKELRALLREQARFRRELAKF